MAHSETGAKRQNTVLAFAVVFIAAALTAFLGFHIGARFIDRRVVSDEASRIDEYQGLGEHTGFTGQLALQVDPMTMTIRQGEPVAVNLILTNKTKKIMRLNGWTAPAPAQFNSNQLPFKVRVFKDRRRVPYRGDAILFPPHTKDDFFELRPNEVKVVKADLARGPGNGVWDISSPGVYTFEVWYETYLTGRYIGVDAWTGKSNNVMVKVTVQPGAKR